MNSRTDQGRHRRSSKPADLSTNWSQWAHDEKSGQYYRARKDKFGKYVYDWSEWNTPAANSASDVPRTDPVPATLSPYPGSTTSSDYGSEYGYQNNQTAPSFVDNTADTFAGMSLDSQGRVSVARSNSFEETVSAENSSPPAAQAVDTVQQSIPIRSMFPPEENYGYQYSMSAPSGGNIGGFTGGTVATAIGYASTGDSGGFASSQNPQAFVPYGRGTMPFTSNNIATGSGWDASSSNIPTFTTYGRVTDPLSLTQQGEASGSGAITPTQANRIKGVEGARKGDEERLDPRFKVHSSKHFKIFQVFKVLWSQPMGETANSSATDVTTFTLGKTKYGQKVHSSIRRFVVVTEDNGHCLCLAISTYQHKGTSKPGLKREDHAIIFTKDRPPKLLKGETTLTKEPIEVIPKTPRDTLEVGSRINYAKIYTVEHNVKVHFVGHISQTSQKRFFLDYDATCTSKRNSTYVAEE